MVKVSKKIKEEIIKWIELNEGRAAGFGNYLGGYVNIYNFKVLKKIGNFYRVSYNFKLFEYNDLGEAEDVTDYEEDNHNILNIVRLENGTFKLYKDIKISDLSGYV